MMDFATRLTERMALQGYSRDALAVKMAEYGSTVQGQSIRLWQRGRSHPAARHLPALTRALRCDLEDLFPLPRPKVSAS